MTVSVGVKLEQTECGEESYIQSSWPLSQRLLNHIKWAISTQMHKMFPRDMGHVGLEP